MQEGKKIELPVDMKLAHNAPPEEFIIEHQYQLFLKRMALQEDMMHPQQKRQLRQAFFGAWGQQLVLYKEHLSKLDVKTFNEKYKDMMNQVGRFFLDQVKNGG